MAILLANYDEQRDYLSNFEPFALDRLKNWPQGQDVRVQKLCEEISKAFSLPAIPINTVTELRDRALHAGYLIPGAGGKHYPNPKRLASVPNIAADRAEVLAHFNALGDSLKEYAKSTYDLDWSDKDIEAALERFVEVFSVEMAMARRAGDLPGGPGLSDDVALAIVHGFARRALERRPEDLQYLEEMVRGSMLTNVIYFHGLTALNPKLDRLIVFLDTPIVLRALGLASEEQTAAVVEMLELLAQFKVPLRVFNHTVIETTGVLDSIKNDLARARQGQLDPRELAGPNREAIEYMMRQGWGPAEVQEITVNIDDRLAAIGAIVEDRPDFDQKLSLSEDRLDEILIKVGYHPDSKNQRTKDVQSLIAIHMLRKGKPARDLAKTPALFVTSNPKLVRASAWFFKEHGHQSPVPQCMSDISLTTQLWLRYPGERRDIAHKFLVAESYAALNPPPELWDRYLDKIADRNKRGDISDEQVQALILSPAAHEGLMVVTQGDPNAVTSDTPLLVLDRYEAGVRAGAEEETRQAKADRERLEEENEELRAQTEKLRQEAALRDEKLATQERTLGEQDKKLSKLQTWHQQQEKSSGAKAETRRKIRKIAGFSGAALVAAAAVAWRILEPDADPVFAGVVFFAATALATVLYVWGRGKALKESGRAFLAAGAALGIFFMFVGFFYDQNKDSESSSSAPPTEAPTQPREK